ncbi:hydrolase [Peribacillus glennii]|uniref:hydrolase n=1 Tax=Peribacillus glennii TaxID=2303991 RepID=UPI00389A47C8
MKNTYYVDLVSGDVLDRPAFEENPSFKIEATDEELHELKSCLDESYTADMQAYIRSHIPYVEYHKDPANDLYDQSIKKIYAIIYKLGDAEARRFIEEIGILEEDKFMQDEEIQKFK